MSFQLLLYIFSSESKKIPVQLILNLLFTLDSRIYQKHF